MIYPIVFDDPFLSNDELRLDWGSLSIGRLMNTIDTWRYDKCKFYDNDDFMDNIIIASCRLSLAMEFVRVRCKSDIKQGDIVRDKFGKVNAITDIVIPCMENRWSDYYGIGKSDFSCYLENVSCYWNNFASGEVLRIVGD